MKDGAWTPCPTCNHQPSGVEELAKALIVSDSVIASDKLEEFAARRQQGEPWIFDPKLVEMFKLQVKALIPMDADGHPAPMESGPPAAGAPTLTDGDSSKPMRKPWWRFWN